MARITWKGASGDWSNAANWSGSVLPGASDTAAFTGSGYTVTVSTPVAVGSVTFNAPGSLLWDSDALTLGGTFSLQAGTLALAYGSITGGTLALAGGMFQASGGTLNGVAVQGPLALGTANASLFVQGGLSLSGAGGTGAGSLSVTGSNAALTFLGSQGLGNASVSLGCTAAAGQGGIASLGVGEAYGATSGATLTLANSTWLRETGGQGLLQIGGTVPSAYTDAIVNAGTITAAVANSTLTIAGTGAFSNTGTIAVSNGATLDLACAGFSNTGTVMVSGGGVLDLGGTFAGSLLGTLGALSIGSGGALEIGGDLLNAGGTLSVGSGSALGPILLAGTISGGTVLDSGGGLNFSAGTGVLDGATYRGTLALTGSAELTLADTTVLTTSSGAGTASITGPASSLFLQGQTLLDHAILSIGSATGVASLGTADPFLASTATTATLGSSLSIQQTGLYAAVNANANTSIAGFGLADTLVNDGTINGAIAGGTLTLGGGGTLINAGMISVSNGDTLVIDPALFSNTGTIAIGSNATAILGGPPNIFGQAPAWSNTGVISVNGGTLTLAGSVRTGQLGRISASNATISLAGTLANAGSTLTLGSGGLPALSLSGTIQGGTIADAGGLLTMGSGGTAVMDGVTDTGTLNLSNAGATLRIRTSLTLLGTAQITGAGARLGFQGMQTFDKALIRLGASGQAAVIDVLHDPTLPGGSTLTLGPTLAVTQAGALVQIGSAVDQANDAIISYGTVTAGVAGGNFTLAGANFVNRGTIAASNGDTLALTAASFSNTGTISVSNAALAIGDSVSLTALGKLVLSNAAISIGGTLSAAGGTLSIGAGTSWGRVLLTGTIQGDDPRCRQRSGGRGGCDAGRGHVSRHARFEPALSDAGLHRGAHGHGQHREPARHDHADRRREPAGSPG